MIAREREDIERISQELPPQYRPPFYDEFISAPRRGGDQHETNQQQFMGSSQPQKASSNFSSVSLPSIENNELVFQFLMWVADKS